MIISTKSSSRWRVAPIAQASVLYLLSTTKATTKTDTPSHPPFSTFYFRSLFPSPLLSSPFPTPLNLRSPQTPNPTNPTPPPQQDVVTCNNNGRLPTESSVVSKTSGSTCYASISVGIATTKGDASAAQQAVVLGKLGGILSCLPA